MFCSTSFLTVTCLLISSAASQKLRTVACEGSAAQLKCDKGEVISVSSATYGRRDQETCSAGRPVSQIQNVRCSRSLKIFPFIHLRKPFHPHKFFVGRWGKGRGRPGQDARLSKDSSSDKVAQRCNGQQSCSISAANSEFGDPCVGTYKYLEVEYKCQSPESSPQKGPTVACEGSAARLQCDKGEVISVSNATYGRRDQKTCSAGRPVSQIQNVRCSSSSDKVAQRCNGQQSCSISAANSEFGDPCVGTYKYLEVEYKCQSPESSPQKGPTVACEGSVARLQCDKGEVISVSNATYGRRDQKTCSAGRPVSQIQNVRCSSSSDKVAQRCNGKRWCNVSANNSMFGDPCVGTYKYLEVDYVCYAFVTG